MSFGVLENLCMFSLCGIKASVLSPPQGSPQMIRKHKCMYVFEWATPLVCSDATQTKGCTLTDSQLQFTFDLSPLSGEIQVV